MEPSEPLNPVSSVGRRAAIGALLVATRTVLVQIAGLGAFIVIARHLPPRDLGLLALGLTITAFVSVFADGGLAAGLIRERRRPTSRDLRVALGLQIATMTALLAIAATAVLPFPQIRVITLLLLMSLPLTAFQTPAKVLLERDLDYRRVVMIEVGGSIVYYSWATVAVILGYGLWGIASASVAGAAAGTTLALALVPAARILPVFSLSSSRKLLHFGVRYQAVNFVNLARDQGINMSTGALVGTSGLGIWTLANRILQVPMMLFSTLWRVSYPAMSRIVAGDAKPRELLERAAVFTAAASGLLLSTLAAIAPAIVPVLFGARWAQAAWVVAPACAALMIGGPVSVAAAGYLYAIGDTNSVLRSAVLHTLAWIGAALALLPFLGVTGVGVGWIAGSLVDGIVLGRAANRHCGAHLYRPLVGPLVAAFSAGGAGFAVAATATPSLGAAAVAGAVSLSIYIAILGVSTRTSSGAPIKDALAQLIGRAKRARLLPSTDTIVQSAEADVTSAGRAL